MSKIKIVDSTDEFLSVVEKSGLLSGPELESARKVCAETDDPKTAARKLLNAGVLTHWQVSQMLAGFAGLVTGKYELLDVIGKGEFGRVYLAEHVTMGQKVALKTLSTKNVTDPQVIERFLEDARTSSKFEHRNVVRVLDISSENDRHYVATEYLSGGDLQNHVEKNGPLAPTDCAEYLAQAAEGMAYVHSKGVLHRSLKPANLVLNDKGVIKLLDVGVGQLRQEEKPSTESSGQILLSSLGYVSPEQARGKDIDIRSDIYALGGILYFLLSGRAPYSASNDEEKEVIQQTKHPVSLAKLRPDAPTELSRLSEEMMALRPADRPASMEEISRRLRSFLSRFAEAEEPVDLEAAVVPVVEAELELAKRPVSDTIKVADTRVPDAKVADPKNSDTNTSTASTSDRNTSDIAAVVEIPVFASAEEEARSEPAEEAAAPIVGIQTKARDTGAKDTTDKAVPVVGFNVQKKRKTKTAPSEAAPGSSMSAAALVHAKRQKARLQMLALSVAALALLGIFALVTYFVMMPNDNTVAEATPPAAKGPPPADTTAATPAVEPAPVEPVPAASTNSAPPAGTSIAPGNSSTTSVAVPGTSLTGAPATNPTPPGTTTTAPTIPTTAGLAGGTSPPAAPAAGNNLAASTTPTTPANPLVNPPATTAETPTNPPATAKPESPPAAKPESKPDPAATAKTEVKPETKPETKPEAKPAAAADKPAEPKDAAKDTVKKAEPAAKVFEIAAAVDLPRLSAADGSAGTETPAATVLGRIHVDPKTDCFVSLLGGENAMKGKSTFSIRSAQGGTAPRDWEFVYGDATNAETVIGLLSLSQQELKFDWTPEGLKNNASTHLRNCALRIRAGQEKPYTVALRKPQFDPPASLAGMEKSSVTLKFNFDAAPDTAKLRLEPKIPDIKSVFDNGGQADATKGEQWICFGESKDKSVLRIKVATVVNTKGIQLTLTPHVVVGNEKAQKLTPAIRKSISIPLLVEQKTTWERRKAELDKTPLEKAAQVAPERDALAIRIKEMESTIQKLTQLEEVLQKLNSASLHVRVYYDAVETQVDLVRTDAPPPAG